MFDLGQELLYSYWNCCFCCLFVCLFCLVLVICDTWVVSGGVKRVGGGCFAIQGGDNAMVWVGIQEESHALIAAERVLMQAHIKLQSRG